MLPWLSSFKTFPRVLVRHHSQRRSCTWLHLPLRNQMPLQPLNRKRTWTSAHLALKIPSLLMFSSILVLVQKVDIWAWRRRMGKLEMAKMLTCLSPSDRLSLPKWLSLCLLLSPTKRFIPCKWLLMSPRLKLLKLSQPKCMSLVMSPSL